MQAIGKRNSLARAVSVLMLLVSCKEVWADTAHDELGEAAVTHRVNPGAVWAWGYNGFGELADGTALQPATPVQVAGLAGLPAIAAGNDFTPPLDDSPRWASWNHVRRYQGDGKPNLRVAFNPASGATATVAIASFTSASFLGGLEGLACPGFTPLEGWHTDGTSPCGSYSVGNFGRVDITGMTRGNTIS